ncbi:hypothetical protein V6N12_031603 [Hibiscus sabdariffa]|uniref:Uncharacterized protein n=1 Tax=Hibiscus sabdariffa TaxID=183260 RepID=A0ABR2DUZ8_9ROSI
MLPENSLLKSLEIKINGIFDDVMYLKKSLKVINCNFNLGIGRDGPRPVASVLEFDFDSIEPKERTSSNKMGENKVDMLESNIPEQHKPLFPSYETSRLMSQCSTRIVQHRPKEGKGKNM